MNSDGGTDTGCYSILAVQPKATRLDAATLRQIYNGDRVTVVESLEEALTQLREHAFDFILIPAQDFSRTNSFPLGSQALSMFENVLQGVCIVSGEGHLVWANPKMLGFPDDVREKVCAFCVDTIAWAALENNRRALQARGRRFSISGQDHSFYEVTATPIIDLDHRVTQVAAVVWEATQLKRMQEKLDAIDKAGFELVRLDAEQIGRLDAHQRLALLEQKIIRYTRELMRFDNFAIRLLDKKSGRLELVLSAGMPTEAQELTLTASSEGNGISGYVAHSGRSYICANVSKDPRYLAGITNAKSSLTVPLRLHDQVVGIFNVESDDLNAFSEDDRQFAEIFARHVAMALHILDLLVTERRTATGKIGDDVMAEIRAPLNDIMTDIASLKEDYIGLDDLRHRLDKISDNAVAIREAIKQVTAPRASIIGRPTSAAQRHDPVLSGKCILVADDEDTIRDTVRDVLSCYGCRVEAVKNGQLAIDALGQKTFDLVLSDIRMPDKDGYQVFAAAKNVNADLPVILMTGFGYDPNHSIIRARREGLAAVLFKPFKVDQLLGELKSALTRAAVR